MSEIILPYRVAGNQALTKNRILAATIYLMTKLSYSDVSLDKIASLSGIKKQSILHHFISKKDIVVHAISMISNFQQQLLFHPLTQPGLSQEQKVEKFHTNLLESLEKYEGIRFVTSLTISSTGLLPELKKPLTSYYQSWINAIQTFFAETHSEAKAKELAKDWVLKLNGALALDRLTDDFSAVNSTFASLLVPAETC